MKFSDAKELAAEALKMTSPKEIYALCEEFYNERVKME